MNYLSRIVGYEIYLSEKKNHNILKRNQCYVILSVIFGTVSSEN